MASYLGKVTGIINTTELFKLVGLYSGTDMYTGDITWLKFNMGDNLMFVADRNLRHTVSPQQLGGVNILTGKEVNIGGKKYTCRCISVSEWDETIVAHVPNNSDSNWSGVQSWTCDAHNPMYTSTRGGASVEFKDYWQNTYTNVAVGFRPVLIANKGLEKLPLNSTLTQAVNACSSLKNEIMSQKNTLSSILESKGVAVLPTDKTSDLIGKVENIKGFPTGWDSEKTGEVMTSNVTEGDALIWQKYGNLETNVTKMIDTPNVATSGNYVSAISPDGSLYACVYSSQPSLSIYRYNDNSFTPLTLPSDLPKQHVVSQVKFSSNNKYMFTSYTYGSYYFSHLWELVGDTFKLVHTFNVRGWDADFSADSKYIALCGYDGNSSRAYQFKVHKINDNGSCKDCGGYEFSSTTGSYPGYVKMSPSGRCAYFYGSDTYYSIYVDKSTDVATNYYAGIRCGNMCFSNNGKYMYLYAPLGVYGVIRVYSYDEDLLAQGKSFMTQLHESSITSTIMTTDSTGSYLALGASNVACSLYKLNDNGSIGSKLNTIEQITVDNNTRSLNMQFTTDNRMLFISGGNKLFYRIDNKEIIVPYDMKYMSSLQTEHKYLCVALESKNIGQQLKVNCFPKLNIGGVSKMIERIKMLEEKVQTLEENDKAVLRNDMQTLAYNLYPEDFASANITQQNASTLEEKEGDI